MSIRAVICDIYQTVLEVCPPPADAAARWAALWLAVLKTPPRISLDQFSAQTQEIIDREHGVARNRGALYPEIFWSSVVCNVLPELDALAGDQRDNFVWQQISLLHSVRLNPGAAEGLRALHARGIALGIASNAQGYTLKELDAALAPAGLSRQLFTPSLCFFSFEHGFSKPDPEVFHWVTARLGKLGIAPHETVMIGNRLDNDIGPAKAQGWQTWHFAPPTLVEGAQEGDWAQFMRWLDGQA